jgi:MoxR-like ATPase
MEDNTNLQENPLNIFNSEDQFVKIQNTVNRIKQEIQQIVIGQNEMIDLMLAALFTGGHVLLEGVPGIGKTMTAKLLSQTLNVGFSRIQFTPDLMPTDVTGTSVFNMKTSEFYFKKGPVFSNVILIDEINRAPAKTQSSLFEVMEEKQVTIDGVTNPLTYPFFVIATQNPIEQEGTYKLPEAQLDRFIFRLKINYPSLQEEKLILTRFRDNFTISTDSVKPVLSAEEIRNCASAIEKVFIKDELISYIAEIINNTRNNGDLFLGASPRASLAILRTSKCIAAINGRGFVIPDDIQYVSYHVLNHRIILTPEREMEGLSSEDIIKGIIQSIEVPR